MVNSDNLSAECLVFWYVDLSSIEDEALLDISIDKVTLERRWS